MFVADLRKKLVSTVDFDVELLDIAFRDVCKPGRGRAQCHGSTLWNILDFASAYLVFSNAGLGKIKA